MPEDTSSGKLELFPQTTDIIKKYIYIKEKKKTS
jgi:hypothetical protein